MTRPSPVATASTASHAELEARPSRIAKAVTEPIIAPVGRAGEPDVFEGHRRDGEHRQGVVDGIVAGHHQKPGDQSVQMVAEQS